MNCNYYKMKQKRDVTLITFGVVLLFLISACDGGGDIIGGAPTTPFLGGSQGLTIDFLEGSPPDEVTDGGTFPFQALINLKNEGEHDLAANKVQVDLIGFLPSDFGVTDPAVLEDRIPDGALTARKRDSEGNIIEPVESFVTFPTTTTNFNFGGSVVGNTVFIFRTDVCYLYQTDAVAEICVLENLVDVADDAICDPSSSKSAFSSGSPLGVTSFRQNVAGTDRIQFSFDIVHSGSGNIFEPTDFSDSAVDDCPKNPTQRRTKEDNIKVTVDTGLVAATNPLNCVGLVDTPSVTTASQTGTVRLVNGRRTVTCTQTLASDRTDFKRNVDITLDFNYLDSTDQEVLVKHLIG